MSQHVLTVLSCVRYFCVFERQFVVFNITYPLHMFPAITTARFGNRYPSPFGLSRLSPANTSNNPADDTTSQTPIAVNNMHAPAITYKSRRQRRTRNGKITGALQKRFQSLNMSLTRRINSLKHRIDSPMSPYYDQMYEPAATRLTTR